MLAGSDAHARLGWRAETDPDTNGWNLPMPGYRLSFAVFSNQVVLDRALTGNAADDASQLLAAIRAGKIFTVIDGLASPAAFEFTAVSGDQTATLGETLTLRGQASLHARIAAPAGALMTLVRNGENVKQTNESEIAVDVNVAGAYRTEVTLPGNAVPWVFSNPIYIGLDAESSSPVQPAAVVSQTSLSLTEASGESSAGSTNELTRSADITWDYRLATGTPAGQYAAVRLPASGLPAFTRVRFDVGSDRPMRLWVQLRRPDGAGERWGRTVYIDQADRTIDLRLESLAPIGVTTTARAALAQVDSLLFVVDTVNTLPGSSGRVRLRNIAFVR